MKNVLVFGVGKISEVATSELAASGIEISAYCTEHDFVPPGGLFLGKPVYPLSIVRNFASREDHQVLIAVGYQELNSFRRRIFDVFSGWGYQFFSFRPENLSGVDFALGKNSFVASGVIVQPKAVIGDNVWIWSGAVIGHHSEIAEDVWISSGAVVGGSATIGKASFLGMNACIQHEVEIANYSLVGAMANVRRTYPEGTVLVAANPLVHPLNSTEFIESLGL